MRTLKVGERWLADRIDVEPDLVQLFAIQDIAAVEHKGWMDHRPVDGLIVQLGVLGPLGHHSDGVSALSRLVWVRLKDHLIGNVQVELDGDEARCRCLFQAQHLRHGAEGGSLYLLGGEYHDALRRTEAGWRIQQREIRVIWQDGNPAVLTG